MFQFRNKLACSSCLTATFATVTAGLASAAELRDPWKNLRIDGEPVDKAKAARASGPAKAATLDTAEATYAVDQGDVDHNLGVLLDRSYGASGPAADDRKFVPGIDGFAGDEKWRPFVEFTVAPGNKRTHGQINLFAPLAQDADSLLFTDLRASAWTDDVQEGNFGLGYRQIVPGGFFGTDAIFGVYGFFDARRSSYGNMFYQGTLGGEIITENFEFRANAYLPSGNQYVVGSVASGAALSGRNFVYVGSNLVERALPGFDVEAGVKLDFSEAAIRLNAGYFRFERGSTLVEGPRFRAEVEIDDPFGFDGAKLSIGGEIRSDKVRGTEASGIVRLRMPIGGASEAIEAERQLSGLDRLMTRRIYRDDDIVTPAVTQSSVNAGNPVLDAISGQSLQGFFVANSAQGAADCSSVGNACDFVTAQGLAGAGDVFLPVDVAGAIGSIFTLNADRQQVIGGGNSGTANIILSDAANTMAIVTSLGGRPIVTGVNIGHFADTRVAGLTTSSATGITGDGMTGTISVSDIVTNGGGLNFANSAAAIVVSDTAVNNGAAGGIVLTNLTGSASFSNVDVTSAGGTGLSVNGGSVGVLLDAASSLTQSGAGAAIEVLGSHTGTLTSNATISATAGTGLQFNNADGTYNFNGPSNLNGGDAGIDILGGSAGSFTFGAATAIMSPTGIAFNVDGSAATVNYGGTITQNNAANAVSITNNTGGTLTFTGLITANTSTATGVNLSGNTGASVVFAGGLDIDTTTGTGFSATGGGTVTVTATAGDESIVSAAGQALNLNGVTIGAGGVTFDSLSSTGSAANGIDIATVGGGAFTVSGATMISGSTGNAIELADNSAAINFNGSTSITMTSPSVGVDFSGTTTGAVSFADLDIALQSDNSTGVDFSGAMINANVLATDFDLTSTSTNGTTGVDLSGTTGTGTIRLGDAAAAGQSATIAGVNVGVRFSAGSNATFIFGDGESGVDTGSSISGLTAIAGGSTVTLGSYDFDDVNFTGTLDFATAGGDLVFVAATATGDGSGSSVSNRANVITADAISTIGVTFVLINDGAVIDDVDGFTLEDGQTMASFGNGRSFTTSGLIIPGNFSGVPGAGTTVTDPDSNGAAILTRTGGAGDTLMASGTVNLQDFIIENAASGAGLSATGATTITSTGLTIQNVAGQGIDLDNLTGPASTFNNTVVSTGAGNAVDIVNSTVNFTGGLDIDTSSGIGFNVTGGGTVSVIGTSTINVTGPAVNALNMNGVAIGAGGVNFASITSSGTTSGHALAFDGVTGGAFNGGDVTVAGTGGSGDGISINASSATFGFGNVSISSSEGDGVALNGANGDVTIEDLTLADITLRGVEILNATNNVTVNGGSSTSSLAFPGFGVTIHDQAASSTIAFTNFDITGSTDNTSADYLNIQDSAGTITFVGGTFSGTSENDGVDIDGGTATISIGATINHNGSNASASNVVEIDGVTGGSISFTGDITGSGSGNAIDIGSFAGNSGVTVTFDGAISQTANSTTVVIVGNTGGSYTFNGPVTANSSTANAINLNNNTGASIAFNGGLNIDTTSGIGFNATNGGTISVAATGGDESINSAGIAVNLGGVTIGAGGITFDSIISSGAVGPGIGISNTTGGTFTVSGATTIGGATGNAIALNNNSADVQFGATTLNLGTTAGSTGIIIFGNYTGSASFGATSITGGATTGQIGVDLRLSTLGGALSFTDLDVNLTGDNSVAMDLSNATINANITAGDFDVTTTSSTGTVGVNLVGTTGTGTVQLGDTNINGGENVTLGSSTNTLAIGVQVDGATELAFVLGDGNGATGDLVASDIHATTAISGTLPGTGTYNFRDIEFNASGIANISGGASFFVFDEEGTAGAGTFADPGTAEQAAAANVNVLVAIDNSGVSGNVIDLSSAGQGSINTLSLDDNQALISLSNGQSIDVSTLISGLGGAAPVSFLFTNVGGTTTITGSGVAGGGPATITTIGANNTVSLAGSAGIQSVNITNGGSGHAVVASPGAAENIIIRSSEISGGVGGDSINIATTAGASTFEFFDLALTGSLRLNGSGGGSLTGTATGANTLTSSSGVGILVDTVSLGAGGFLFDTVAVTNGGADAGISFDTVATVSGTGIVIGSADLDGHTGSAINVADITGPNGFLLTSADIDLGAGGTGVTIGGANSVIAIGNGTSNSISGLSIDGGAVGMAIGHTAGIVNIASTAASGSLLSIGTTSQPTNGLVVSSVGSTLNIGNTSNLSTILSTGTSVEIDATSGSGSITLRNITTTSTSGNGVEITNSSVTTTTNLFDIAISAAGTGLLVQDNENVVRGTNIDVNQASSGVVGSDTNSTGSLIIDGLTVDNTSDDAVLLQNINADLTDVTIGADAAVSGDAIQVDHTINSAHTVLVNGLTVGSTGDTNDVGGRGIFVNQTAGTGTVTVSLSGANQIHTTGAAIETLTAATANILRLGIAGTTTVESASAGPTIAINGDSINSSVNSTIVTGFAGVTVIGNGVAGGVLFDNVTFDANTAVIGTSAPSSDQVSFGTLQIGQSAGARVAGNGLTFNNAIGDVDLTTLNIFNDSGTGLYVNTKTPTGGGATNFQMTGGGSGTIDTTDGAALFLDPLATDLTFGTVSSVNSTTTGVHLDAVSEAVGATSALTITNLIVSGATAQSILVHDTTGDFVVIGGTITNTGAGIAVQVGLGTTASTGSSGDVSIGADINSTGATGGAVQISERTGGTVTISGNLTDDNATGGGINVFRLDNGTASAVNFTGSQKQVSTANSQAVTVNDNINGTVSFTGGGLVIDTTTQDGFQATGAGIVNVSGSGNSITTTTATALNLADVTANIAFTDISISALTGDTGVSIIRTSGSVTASGGTIDFSGTGTAIGIGNGATNSGGSATIILGMNIDSSGATGRAVTILNLNGADVTISGNLTDDAAIGGHIAISGSVNGTSSVTFSGNQKQVNSGTNSAVSLQSNPNGTINFTGGALDIDTTSGPGFVYDAGGTVVVTDLMTIDATGTGAGLSVVNDGTGSFTANNAGNTIATVSGLALEISTSTVNATFNSVSASALNGNYGIYAFEHSGTLTVNGGTLTNLGNQAAISISGGSGTIAVASNINSTGAIGLALGVNTRMGGTFTYSGNLIDDGAQGGGIDLNNNTAGTINITGASKVVNTGPATGVRLFLNSGTSTFNFTNGGLDIDTTSGTGFIATGGGTVNVSDAGNTITTTSGTLIDSSDVASVTFDARFDSASASALNGNNGIDLRNASGTLTILGGTITNNGIGAAVRLLEGNATLNLATNVVSAGLGGAVNIQNITGGANTFSGVFSDTNANGGQMLFAGNTGGSTSFSGNVTIDTGGSIALTLSGSAAHAITFSGTNTVLSTTSANVVDISNGATVNFNSTGTNTITATTSGKGVEANGGGTVVIGGTANVTSATGTAVDIQNTTIGAGGVTFRSVSANGAANGIVLNNTGTTGRFRVAGSGSTAGSGGTIQNTSGDGISLTNVTNVSLANMNIIDTGRHGIFGSTVTQLDLNGVVITGAGDAANEDGINITNLVGTGAQSSHFQNIQVLRSDGDNGIRIQQTAAVTGELLIDGASVIEDSQEVAFEARTQVVGSALNITIGNSSAVGVGDTVIIDNALQGLDFFAEQGVINATVQNSIIRSGSGSAAINRSGGSGTNGVLFVGITGQSTDPTADINLTVIGNDIDHEDGGATGTGRVGVALGGGGNVNGTIQNNSINSNDEFVKGIYVNFFGVGSLADNRILIDNNIINLTGSGSNQTIAGIQIEAHNSTGSLSTTITNNIINSAGANSFSGGIVAIAGDSGGGDANTLCVDIRNNSSSAPNAIGGGDDYTLVTFTGTTLQVEGVTAAPSVADIQNAIVANNGGTTTTSDVQPLFGVGNPGTFAGVPSCP